MKFPVPWSFETLNRIVDAEIEGLAVDIRARLARYAVLIEAGGLQALPPAATKHLKGRLWELRLTGRDGIARVIYVTASGMRVVVVRAFVKKTQKTPASEIELALKRAAEVT